MQIRDLTVSRRHARLRRTDGRYFVEDLGSGNGTLVNDEPVAHRALRHGDLIQVCSARFRFEEVELPREVTVVGEREKSAHIVDTVDANRPVMRQDALALTTLTDPKQLLELSRRLETTYAVSEAISSILDLDELLPEIAGRVLDVFPKAERVLLLLGEEDAPSLVPKAVKRRAGTERGELQLSRTILEDVIQNHRAVLSHDAREDQRFKAGRSVANFGIRAMMAAPLIWRGEVLGVLYLDSHGVASFAQADLHLLTSIAGQCAAAVGNARLHEELLKRQRLEQDLQLAERIQQSFLPRRIPKIDRFTFAARYDPAYEVGGDFYDFIHLPDERLGVVVADVSGKGVGAALYMARLTRDLRYFALAETDPARVLAFMNQAVVDFGQDDMFVTLIYVVIDERSRELTIANAGHMPPLVRRAKQGSVRLIDDVAGLPLGVLPETDYDSELFALQPGDSVMLYTDGLVEAMSPGREMFGIQRLMESVAHGSSAVSDIIDRTLKQRREHVQDAAQFDDTTIVCFGLDRASPQDRVGSPPRSRRPQFGS